jgi:hypothetical protein
MRRFVSVAFALATLATPLAAQSHPDFSGKWVLDPKSVEAGMMAGPTSATMTVAQDAKTVKVDNVVNSQMGEQKTSLTFNLDGTSTKNTIAANGMSLDLTSTAAWEGQTLAVTTSGDVGGQTLQFVERWSLDDGGKVLRMTRDISAGGQSMSMKFAFNKQ